MEMNDDVVKKFMNDFLDDMTGVNEMIEIGYKPSEIMKLGLTLSVQRYSIRSYARKRMVQRMKDLHALGEEITIRNLRYEIESSRLVALRGEKSISDSEVKTVSGRKKSSSGRKYQEPYETAVSFYNAYRNEIERLNEKLKDEN